MSSLIVGLLFAAALLVLIALRVPMAVAMICTAGTGVFIVAGWDVALFQVGAIPFAVTEYSLTVVPLFILMAEFAARSGLARDLYDAAAAFVGHWRGGLSMATLLGCAGFATISGSSLATAATIGGVALEEMRRFQYDTRLAAGTVAVGGTIGILIPPSLVMVIYAVMTDQSIGKLFAAGFLPGILLTALCMSTVLIWVRLHPAAAPSRSRRPFREKVRTLKRVAPILVIFVVVIGGIYGGVFTPTEAAGVGAFITLVVAVSMGRMSLSAIRDSLIATASMSAMLFLIVIGSSFFSFFLTITGMTFALQEFIDKTGMPSVGILMFVIAIYIVLGCFMETMGMILLTVPVFFPTLVQAGYDPIWFGIILVMVVEVGLVTPPLGLNVYVIQGVAPDIPLMRIFVGIAPFLLAFATALLLLIVFPEIALWLPRTLFS